jgi:hypothetical protein
LASARWRRTNATPTVSPARMEATATQPRPSWAISSDRR